MMRAARVSMFLLLLPAACGLENALVGGRCRDGLEEIDGRCAPYPATPSTPKSGEVPPGVPVGDGGAERSVTGSVGGVTRDGGAIVVVEDGGADATVSDATVSDAAASDATASDATTGDATVVDANADAPLVCALPLVACRGKCIDVSSDGANCGACGKICPSNICINGECQGATPGDVVAIGHDFAPAWPGSAQAKVLVNAVSIPTSDPIRILALESGAPGASVAQANAIITAGVAPRTVAFTNATAADLESTTLNLAFDVVLVHDVTFADPAAVGAKWSASLGRFTEKGGVVVMLDGASARMPELVSSTQLLSIGGHAVLPAGTHVVVDAPADVVGAQVISPYSGPGTAVTFSGVTFGPNVTAVVRSEAGGVLGDAVVVHRVVR